MKRRKKKKLSNEVRITLIIAVINGSIISVVGKIHFGDYGAFLSAYKKSHMTYNEKRLNSH